MNSQPKRRDFPGGLEGHRQYKRAWYQFNKETVASDTKKWRDFKQGRNDNKPCPEACEVCGRLTKLVYDHNHETGKFRGWLCNPCNGIIGVYGEDVEAVKRLLAYLERGQV